MHDALDGVGFRELIILVESGGVCVFVASRVALWMGVRKERKGQNDRWGRFLATFPKHS